MITDGSINNVEKAIRILRECSAAIDCMKLRIKCLENMPDAVIHIHQQGNVEKVEIIGEELLSILKPRLTKLNLHQTAVRNTIESEMRHI